MINPVGRLYFAAAFRAVFSIICRSVLIDAGCWILGSGGLAESTGLFGGHVNDVFLMYFVLIAAGEGNAGICFKALFSGTFVVDGGCGLKRDFEKTG